MHFTQEDYKKIESWLLRNSVKDTEFQEALPLTGDESVVITQDNHNRNLKIKDFVDEIIKIGIADFLNVTERYKSPNITLKEAIALVPDLLRKKGQVITFSNPDGNWEIYQFTGALNQWNNVTLWEDVFNIDKFIINSILPDEEDLTKSEPDENGNSYLSLKDREYNPTEFSGLGRVILRKNLVEFEDGKSGKVIKNYLSQKDLSKENTIYEIRYDFDLNNQTIYIPTGCQFDYVGGSLSNGKVVYNNTLISGNEIIKSITREGNYNYLNSVVDNEDLVSVDGKLSLKDRSALNGMGYVILRKNKTFAEQVTKENTIYEIRYDFDLENGAATIPDGCILDFKGGSLSNGTIVGFNTSINKCSPSIFENIIIEGVWNVPYISTRMFKDASQLNALVQTFNLTNPQISNYVTIEEGTHIIENNLLYINSNTTIHLIGDIHIVPNGEQSYNMIILLNSSNIHIYGSGSIVGDMYEHDYSAEGTHEWGVGIRILGSDDVKIEGITIKDCTGDSLNLGHIAPMHSNDEDLHGKPCTNITVSNCKFIGSRRQGITMIMGQNILIENCSFDSIYGYHTENMPNGPGAAIDIEPNDVDYIARDEWKVNDRIRINNCHVKSCNRGIISFIVKDDYSFSNVEVANCTFEGNTIDDLCFDKCKNIFVDNCTFQSHIVFSRSSKIALLNCASSSLVRFLNSTKDVSIENCSINSYIGFEFTRGDFSGFVLLNNIFEGTYLSQGDGIVSNATITGNSFRFRFNLSLKNSLVENNEFYPCETVNPSYLLYLSGDNLGNNTFIGNRLYGSAATSVTACFVATSDNLFLGNTIGINTSRNFVIQGNNNRGFYNRVPYGNVVSEGTFMDVGANGKTPISPQIGQSYYNIDIKRSIHYDTSGWLEYDGELAGIPRNGDWKDRFTPNNKGFQFFCSSKDGAPLNKPAFYNGSSWQEADGNPVGYRQLGPLKNAPTDVIVTTAYFCYDKGTPESGSTGMMMFSNGGGVWLDGLGRVVDDNYSNKYAIIGSTSERPTNAVVGHQFFDISINKPIWHKGANVWVDATGAIV